MKINGEATGKTMTELLEAWEREGIMDYAVIRGNMVYGFDVGSIYPTMVFEGEGDEKGDVLSMQIDIGELTGALKLAGEL